MYLILPRFRCNTFEHFPVSEDVRFQVIIISSLRVNVSCNLDKVLLSSKHFLCYLEASRKSVVVNNQDKYHVNEYAC